MSKILDNVIIEQQQLSLATHLTNLDSDLKHPQLCVNNVVCVFVSDSDSDC